MPGGSPSAASASFSELQVQRRQCRAAAEGSCCQQYVLHRRMISSGLRIALA
jgi:hypothetical protein